MRKRQRRTKGREKIRNYKPTSLVGKSVDKARKREDFPEDNADPCVDRERSVHQSSSIRQTSKYHIKPGSRPV